MANSEISLPEICFACTNEFELFPESKDSVRRCPFCSTVLWPKAVGETLTQIGNYRDLQPIPFNAPAVVFKAMKDGEQRLLTLLDCGSHVYGYSKSYRKAGREDLYGRKAPPAHPALIRMFPIEWIDDVAFLAIDYFEGKTLGDWIDDKGPLDLEDAVSVLLTCVQVCNHVGDMERAGQLHPELFYVSSTGDVKIASFAGHAFQQFQPEIYERMLNQELKEAYSRKIQLFSPEGYWSPESRVQSTDPLHKFSQDELRRQNIFCLGNLLIELLSGMRSETHQLYLGVAEFRGEHLLHHLDIEVDPRLAPLIQKMTARDALQRMQTYQEVEAELLALGLARQTLEIVNRKSSPRDEEAEQQAEKLKWVRRTDATDLRNIKWGMTADEIRRAEPLEPMADMPAMISFDTEFEALTLTINYYFAEQDGERICVAASLLGRELTGFKKLETTEPNEQLLVQVRFQEIQKQMRREGLHEQALKLQKAQNERDQQALADQKQRIGRSKQNAEDQIRSRQLDVDHLQSVFRQLCKLMTLEYGAADQEFDTGHAIDDSNPLLHAEWMEQLEQLDGVSKDSLREHCYSRHWSNLSTQVVLAIQPMPFGERMIMAMFSSVQYGHLMG